MEIVASERRHKEEERPDLQTRAGQERPAVPERRGQERKKEREKEREGGGEGPPWSQSSRWMMHHK